MMDALAWARQRGTETKNWQLQLERSARLLAEQEDAADRLNKKIRYRKALRIARQNVEQKR